MVQKLRAVQFQSSPPFVIERQHLWWHFCMFYSMPPKQTWKPVTEGMGGKITNAAAPCRKILVFGRQYEHLEGNLVTVLYKKT